MAKKHKEPTMGKPIVKTTEKRMLKVNLTNEELLAAGTDLATAQQRIVELEAELKAFKDSQNGKISEAEAKMSRNSSLVRQKYDWREVQCDVVKDYNAESCMVIRKDTGEVVDNRRMTNAELSELPLDDNKVMAREHSDQEND